MVNLNLQLDKETGKFGIKADEESKPVIFDTMLSMLLSGIAAICKQLIKTFKGPKVEEYKLQMFEDLNSLFDQVLQDLFPDLANPDFDLSVAAMVYAQDQIISKAEAEGKTYKEMLDEYEELAKKYLADKKKEENNGRHKSTPQS